MENQKQQQKKERVPWDQLPPEKLVRITTPYSLFAALGATFSLHFAIRDLNNDLTILLYPTAFLLCVIALLLLIVSITTWWHNKNILQTKTAQYIIEKLLSSPWK